jgi:hypothetical protein
MAQTIIWEAPAAGELQEGYVVPKHGAAREFWSYMGKKYLNRDPWGVLMDHRPVWNLWKTHPILRHEAIVLLSTFDYVMVRRKNLELLLAAFMFVSLLPGQILFMEQLDYLRELIRRDDQQVAAICWTQTTITDMWMVFEEDNDEYRMYNTAIDNDHWFLFDKLGSL